MRTLLLRGLTAGVIAGGSLIASPASATPGGSGVTGVVISQSTLNGMDYIVRRITLPPGQSTGWHYHQHTIFGVVQNGTLSHFDSSCKSDGVYKKGSTITEPGGSKYVHIGRNLGKKPVVLDVVYIMPHGTSLSTDAPNPGCDFQ
ncbi:cupin domain-containing protein [Nonomuraea sp. NPDC049709]|uniref:cupin domain-containing protein n=1 Tax=Nonomuraea sp. NPDC049709 TaxID=3154736 RepID=UPI00341F0904